MKKIYFSKELGLEHAAICGVKTMTRRVVPEALLKKAYDSVGSGLSPEQTLAAVKDYLLRHAPYKVGEVAALAQRYQDILIFQNNPGTPIHENGVYCRIDSTHGWSNKQGVRAELMPHRIRFTGVRIERLRDIPDQDCIREGIVRCTDTRYVAYYRWPTLDYPRNSYTSALSAFVALISRIGGRNIWRDNPWVYAYEFERVR